MDSKCFLEKKEFSMAIFNNAQIIQNIVEDFSMNSKKNEASPIDTKKAEIKKLTQDILDLGKDPSKNTSEIKEKIQSVVSLVGEVISYPDTTPDASKNPLNEFAQNVFVLIDSHPEQKDSIMKYLTLFNGFANNFADAVMEKKSPKP
jgi:hypothetical protein